MRLAEILVVAADKTLARTIIQSISKLHLIDNRITVGNINIDEQLQINLYGIDWDDKSKEIDWEILSTRCLGIIVLFDWESPASIEKMKEVITYFNSQFELPMIISSILKNGEHALTEKLYRGGLQMTASSRFTFFNLQHTASVKEMIVALINVNLELLSNKKEWVQSL